MVRFGQISHNIELHLLGCIFLGVAVVVAKPKVSPNAPLPGACVSLWRSIFCCFSFLFYFRITVKIRFFSSSNHPYDVEKVTVIDSSQGAPEVIFRYLKTAK